MYGGTESTVGEAAQAAVGSIRKYISEASQKAFVTCGTETDRRCTTGKMGEAEGAAEEGSVAL